MKLSGLFQTHKHFLQKRDLKSLDSNQTKKKEMTRKREQHYGKTAKQVSAKLKKVLPRNVDYSKMKSISNTIY
jgi:hypothetical protein